MFVKFKMARITLHNLAVPSPSKVKWKRGNVYENRVLRRHSLVRKYIITFYWLTPFADSFLNSDWLELVIYFQTNEQGGEQNALLVNFSDNSDLRRGFQGKFARLLG